jgi:signal transduction histidine kinase
MQAGMTLRRRAFLAIGGTLVVLGVLAIAAVVVIVRGSFVRLERDEVVADLRRVTRAMAIRADAVATTTEDYAQWDDMVAFMADRSPAFVRSNFSGRTLADLDVNAVLVRDPAGAVVLATGYDEDAGAETAVPPGFVEALDRSGLAAGLDETAPRRHGLLRVGGRPMLVAANAILTSDATGPSRGVLVLGRWIDASADHALSDAIGVLVSLHPLQADDPGTRGDARVDALLGGAPALVEELDGKRIAGWTLLRDVLDEPTLLVGVRKPRAIMAQGWFALGTLLVALLVVGILVIGCTLVVLERSVLRRLSRLSESVEDLAAHPDGTGRVPVEGADELAGLATRINQLLAALAEHMAALREARDAAESANRTKSAFVACMSHELRTPLNIIIGYSEILRETALERDQHDTAHDLSRIHQAGLHLLDLVNDVLDVAKMEADRLELELVPVEVATLLHDVGEAAAPLATAQGNRLRVSCGPDVGWMRADPRRLRQILLNLVANACKFTEDGRVELVAERCAGGVRFRIADTGIGMAPETLSRLFEPFFQADSSMTRRYEGTGLGLAITRRLCRLMGGDVTIASTLGQGTTCTVELPVGDATPGPRPADDERPLRVIGGARG